MTSNAKQNTVSTSLRHLGALMGIVALVSGAARAQEQTTSTASREAATPSIGGAQVRADYRLLMRAARGNLTEIQLAQLVKQKSLHNNAIQNYAEFMIEDHAIASNQLRQVVEQKGLTMPTLPPLPAQGMLKDMSALSNEAFVKRYLSAMIRDHTREIAAYQNEAAHGYDGDIKTYALNALPTLKSQLTLAQALSNLASKTNTNGNKDKTTVAKM